jgi:hypothetical protein
MATFRVPYRRPVLLNQECLGLRLAHAQRSEAIAGGRADRSLLGCATLELPQEDEMGRWHVKDSESTLVGTSLDVARAFGIRKPPPK